MKIRNIKNALLSSKIYNRKKDFKKRKLSEIKKLKKKEGKITGITCKHIFFG